MGEGRKMLERLWNSNSLGNPFSEYSTLRKNMTSYKNTRLVSSRCCYNVSMVKTRVKWTFSAGCTASFLGLTCWFTQVVVVFAIAKMRTTFMLLMIIHESCIMMNDN